MAKKIRKVKLQKSTLKQSKEIMTRKKVKYFRILVIVALLHFVGVLFIIFNHMDHFL